MKFGIMFANTGPYVRPEHATRLAQLAEEVGFESLWTVEHVVLPAEYESPYPYSRDGKIPGGEDLPIPDPLIWLTYVAAATTRIKLATGILILPQRNPVVLAKETATLDVLSGGRLMLGVGIGWLREEFEALGVPFEHRGPRTDEYVAALRELWIAAEPTFQGDFAQFHRAKSYPKPEQAGGIPIVIGGATEAAARRAGRIGDGFFPARGKPEQLQRLFDMVRAAAREAGRDPASIELTASGAFDVEAAKRYADIGVDRLLVPPLGFDPESLERGLRDFGEQVIAPMS